MVIATLIALGVVAGVGWKAHDIIAKAEAAAPDESRLARIEAKLNDIGERVARIEGKLDKK